MLASRRRCELEDGIVKHAAAALDAVSKQYGSGSQGVLALDDVSFSIVDGDFVSVMGQSGSGKTTLLNLIAGLDTPSTGRVLVSGKDMGRLDDAERSELRLRHIGLVFQTFNLFPSFSVEENVAWRLNFSGLSWRDSVRRASDALDEVGIAAAARYRRPAELSGGEQQRVAIARALVTQPQLLLADEPTGNLDSQTGQTILNLLIQLNVGRGVTIMLVTHSAYAATCGRRTIELSDGHVIRDVVAPRADRANVIPLRE
jgi:putative ABC transport system ATP-binding protein